MHNNLILINNNSIYDDIIRYNNFISTHISILIKE